MRVALDTSPIESAHKVRGIGAYTKNLKDEFQKIKSRDLEFEFFTNPASPPPADVVHYPYFDLFARTLPSQKTAKRVVTIHDVIPLVFPNFFPAGIRGYINLFFQKRSLSIADAIICDSKTSKKDIVDKLSQNPDKIHVIYLAPGYIFRKIEANTNLSKKYKLPKEFVLYVGDVNWNKNILNLLEAVSISKKNLVMAGYAATDTSLKETREINSKIRQLHIEPKVTKTGYIPDRELVEIYNLAKATLQPSFYEGFGLPTLESMACGTPVVCSNVSSLSEIAGKDAIFCDPTSPQDIAKKIDEACSLSQKERVRLSQELMEHAAGFSWQKVAKQTIDVYKSL